MFFMWWTCNPCFSCDRYVIHAFNKVKVKSSLAGSPPMENLLPQFCWVNYQLLTVMLPKQPNGRLSVAVDHNQLLTMASEMVDPIDWPLPPHPSQSSTPWAPLEHSTYKSVLPSQDLNLRLPHSRQPPCLCGHPGYRGTFIPSQYTVSMERFGDTLQARRETDML